MADLASKYRSFLVFFSWSSLRLNYRGQGPELKRRNSTSSGICSASPPNSSSSQRHLPRFSLLFRVVKNACMLSSDLPESRTALKHCQVLVTHQRDPSYDFTFRVSTHRPPTAVPSGCPLNLALDHLGSRTGFPIEEPGWKASD